MKVERLAIPDNTLSIGPKPHATPSYAVLVPYAIWRVGNKNVAAHRR